LDYIQIIPAVALLCLGLLYIYSTGQQEIGGDSGAWKRQLRYVLLGFCSWLFFAYVNYRNWKQWALIAYASALTLLVFVLFFGQVRYHARRWFSVYGVFSVQPSEFAKLATILFLAWIMSLRRFNPNKLSHFLGIGAVVAAPFALIKLEPDLGTAMVLLPVAAAMIFVSRFKLKWVILLAIAAAVLVPAVYPFLRPYQKERILVFLHPSRDPDGKGWNSRQSQLAVGSGGTHGKGFMNSTQSTLGFLPKTVADSDFIFSVIAEETGFVGSVSVILCYFLIIFSSFKAAAMSKDPFGRYLAVGIGTLIFAHSAVNIGMTIRLVPVTGLPLPLVSKGGTFVVSMMSALGLLQSIHIHNKGDSDNSD
jgi:rod shape determining protein RodA